MPQGRRLPSREFFSEASRRTEKIPGCSGDRVSTRVGFALRWIIDDAGNKDLQDLLAKVTGPQMFALLLR